MKKQLFILAIISIFLTEGLNAQKVGVNTNSPTNTLHVIPINSTEPLRIEGLKNYQLNDSSLLIVNPVSGVVRYIGLNELKTNVNPNLDNLIKVKIFQYGDTLLEKTSFTGGMIGLISDSLLQDNSWLYSLDSILRLDDTAYVVEDTSLYLISGNDTLKVALPSDLDKDPTNELIDSIYASGDTLFVIENGDTIVTTGIGGNIDTSFVLGDTTLYLISGTDTLTVALPSNSDVDFTNELLDSVIFRNNQLYFYEGGGNLRDSVEIPPSPIDSIKYINDTLTFYQSLGNFGIYIPPFEDVTNELIDSVNFKNDTLTIFEAGNNFKVALNLIDQDSTNELIDTIFTNGDTLYVVENGDTISTTGLGESLDTAYVSGDTALYLITGTDSLVVALPINSNADQDSTNELIDTIFTNGDILYVVENGDTISTTGLGESLDTAYVSGDTALYLITGTDSLVVALPINSNADQDSTNELIDTIFTNGDILYVVENGDTISTTGLGESLDTAYVSGDTALYLITGTDSLVVALPINSNADQDSTNELIDTIFTNGDILYVVENGDTISTTGLGESLDTAYVSGDTALYLITGTDSLVVALPIDAGADLDSTNELIDTIFTNGDTLYVVENGDTISTTGLGESLDTAYVSGDTALYLITGTDSLVVALPINSDADQDSTNELIDTIFTNGDILYVVENGDTISTTGLGESLDTAYVSGDTALYLITGTDSLVVALPIDADADQDSTNELIDTIFTNGDILYVVENGDTISTTGLGESLDTAYVSGDTALYLITGTDSLVVALPIDADADLDSTNELIDTIFTNGDTLYVVENGDTISTTGLGESLDTAYVSGDTALYLITGTDSLVVALSIDVDADQDSTNELIDTIFTNGDTLYVVENGDTISTTGLGESLDTAYISGDTSLYLISGTDSLVVALPTDNDIDSTNELIDSITYLNDTLRISEGDTTYTIEVKSGGIDSVKFAIDSSSSLDTLKLFTSDTTFSIVLEDLDSTNELIDSVTYVNDTLRIFEGDTTFAIEVKSGGIDSVKFAIDSNSSMDTLRLFTPDTAFSIVLEDLDSTNELIDSIKFNNDTLSIYEGDSAQTVVLNFNDTNYMQGDSLVLVSTSGDTSYYVAPNDSAIMEYMLLKGYGSRNYVPGDAIGSHVVVNSVGGFTFNSTSRRINGLKKGVTYRFEGYSTLRSTTVSSAEVTFQFKTSAGLVGTVGGVFSSNNNSDGQQTGHAVAYYTPTANNDWVELNCNSESVSTASHASGFIEVRAINKTSTITTKTDTDSDTTNELIDTVTFANDTLVIKEAGVEHKVEVNFNDTNYMQGDSLVLVSTGGDTLYYVAPNDSIATSNDVKVTPHAQQTTIAKGATLRCFDGVNWEADVVEGFSNANTALFVTPWGLCVDVGNLAGQQQTFIRNVSGNAKFGAYNTKYKRINDGVTGSADRVFKNFANGAYSEFWGDNTLTLDDQGDIETMHLMWANSLSDMAAGNYQEFIITAILGYGYQNNYFRVQRIK